MIKHFLEVWNKPRIQQTTGDEFFMIFVMTVIILGLGVVYALIVYFIENRRYRR